MNFHFAQPQFFWMALLAVPLLGGFFYWSSRVKQKLVKQFVQPRLLASLMVGVSPGRQRLRMVLLGGAVVGALLALARPQWGFVWEEVRQKGLDILVAIDTSRSMLAQDVPPNRLEKAKLAAFDLMRQSKTDRLGLIAFAGTAFLQSPLTVDDEVFRQNVEALSVGIIPQGGTALSEAIRTAIRAFEKDEDNHRVLVLFTDGEDHDADEETLGAAQEAAKGGVKIFTVGVGTPEGELLRVTDAQGNTSFIKDEDGNVVKSHLNESLLEKIATTADGFYLPLRGANPMETLYARGLAPLPKSESTTKLTRTYQERYQWPLGLAVLCLVVEMLLPDRKRVRAAQASTQAPPPERQHAAAIVCLLLAPMMALGSPSSAFRDYQSGAFQDAYDEYQRLLDQKTNDYRLQYDAGTAAYRAKQLEAAEKDLQAALGSAEISSDLPAQERAYYNLGNTLYRSGEPLPDLDKKKARWEKSIENYSRALHLNTNDLDAKNNLAFVKKKLEELKQQQQQQQQQDQKDQQNQKQDQNQNQDQKKQNQDQKQQNQQNQDKSKQQQQAGKQKQQQAQQDQNKEQQQQQQAQTQKDKDKDKAEQAKAGAEDQRDKSSEEAQEAAGSVLARMTPQQALQLLQAQRDYEKTLPFAPETNQPVKVQPGKFKNW
jgi:Ca-activated chloride channel family protein